MLTSVPSNHGSSSPAPSGEASLYLSVVIPVFNEAASLPALFAELQSALLPTGWSYELIFVNDGSTDSSYRALDEICEAHAHVVVIDLRRNFGQTAALMAGFDACRGQIVVSLDADLQNDPADIPRLIQKLEEGYDVVSGWRHNRQDRTLTRTFPSQCANWLIRKFTGVDLHDFGCTLKAYRREVLKGIRLYGEMHRFVPVHAHLQGAAITELPVNHRARQFGRSKYGLSRIYKVMLDLLLLKFMDSHAAKPIHIFGGFGLLCWLASLLTIVVAFAFKFAADPAWQKDFVETPLPVVAAVFILVGFLAILQGLLAEMLMRTYFESQNKRTYVVINERRNSK